MMGKKAKQARPQASADSVTQADIQKKAKKARTQASADSVEYEVIDGVEYEVVSMPLLWWAYTDKYSEHNGGRTIQKHGGDDEDEPGTAVCRLKNRASDDSCIWRFVLHRMSQTYCHLGFVCCEGPEDPLEIPFTTEGSILETMEDAISPMAARVVTWSSKKLRFDGDGFGHDYREDYEVASIKKIEFHLRRSTGSCSIKVNDEELGTVWTGLPTTGVFPAVCLPYNPSIKIQPSIDLEIVSGFEIS